MSDAGSRTPERRILGELNNTKAEPISPTVNLRLLTSLASNLKNVSGHNTERDESPSATPGSSRSKFLPRKQKSLGLLCNKFLSLYPLDFDDNNIFREISLDGTARALGTEKRRIYDIINVLESLEMASKAGKNRYVWHGQSNLTSTLVRLKSTAIRIGLREQIQEIQRSNQAFFGNYDDSPANSEMVMAYEEPLDDEVITDAAIKEDKSLGAMSQKFIMLFLVSMKNGVINLDMAAKVLIIDMDSQPETLDNFLRSRFKTKIRRLYDIANVLTAIGLIKKVYMYDRAMKKPVFKYVGPDVESIDFDADTPIREVYNSPVGMSTPHRRAHTVPRGIRIKTVADAGCKTICSALRTTPITDKRKPRKRKLFDTDSHFTRTHSSPNLDSKSRSIERLDDSILRVAEMELERLNASEESKPKACTKLFTRYNSDSCIVNMNNEGGKIYNRDIPSERLSSENLVAFRPLNNSSNSSNIMITNAPPPMSAIQKSIESKITLLPKPIKQTLIKILPIANVPPLNAVYPQKIIPLNCPTNSTSNITSIARYNIQSTSKPLKMINLANLDPKKLIPIKRSDLPILAPIKTIKSVNTPSKTSYAMLTRIQAPTVSPGDTFKAINVGGTLQLIPIKNNNENNNVNHKNIDDSNST